MAETRTVEERKRLTDEEVEALVLQGVPQRRPVKKEDRPQRTGTEEFIRKQQVFNDQLLDAISEVAGLPADAVGEIAGFFGDATGVDFFQAMRDPVGGSESIREFFVTLGFPETEAETLTEQFVGAVGRGVGEASPFALGGAIAARLLKPALQTTQRGGRFVKEVFSEPFRQTPGRAVSQDVAAGTGAALGAEGGEEFGEEIGAPTTGRTTGSITGGLGGALAGGGLSPRQLIRRGRQTVRGAVKGVPEEDVTRLSQERAARELQERVVARPEETQQILRRGTEESTRAGVRPTSGQASGDVGLQGLERAFAERDPQFNARLQELQERNQAAVRRLTFAVRPNANPRLVEEEIRSRVDNAVDALRTRIAETQERIDREVFRATTPEEASRIAQEHMETAEREFQNQARATFAAVDPEGVSRWNFNNIRQTARAIKKSVRKAENPANTLPSQLIEDILRPSKQGGFRTQETFEELTALRSRISNEIREAAVREREGVSTRQLRERLYRLRDSVDATLDEVGESPKFPDVAQRYQQARLFFREGAKLFREGFAARGLREGPSAIPGSEFLPRALNSKGSKEATEQLSRIYDSDEEAKRAVEDFAVLSLAREASDANGNLQTSKVRAWIKKRRPALQAFPNVLRRLEDIEGLQQRVETLRSREKRVTTFAGKGAVGQVLSDGTPVQEAVSKALRMARPEEEAARLRNILRRNPDAQDGLRRALWDEMMLKASSPDQTLTRSPLLRPFEMTDFINRHLPAMKALGYTDNEIGVLIKAAKQAEVISRTAIPSPSVRIPTEELDKFFGEFTLNQLLSRLYGIQRGVVSGRFVAGEVGSRMINHMLSRISQEQTEAILKEALVNPKLAAELLTPLEKVTEQKARRILHALTVQSVLTAQDLAEIEEVGEEQ